MRACLVLPFAALALAACDRAHPARMPPSPPAPAASGPVARIVVRFTGKVGPQTAQRFADLVSNQEGQVIGLKVAVQPGTDADFRASRYLAEVDGDMFILSIGDGGGEGDGMQLSLPSGHARLAGGVYAIDGAFRVRAAGMHQGVTAWALEPVPAPAGPLVRIRDQPLD